MKLLSILLFLSLSSAHCQIRGFGEFQMGTANALDQSYGAELEYALGVLLEKTGCCFSNMPG